MLSILQNGWVRFFEVRGRMRVQKKILQLQMIKDKEEDPRYTKAMAVQSSTALVLQVQPEGLTEFPFAR